MTHRGITTPHKAMARVIILHPIDSSMDKGAEEGVEGAVAVASALKVDGVAQATKALARIIRLSAAHRR